MGQSNNIALALIAGFVVYVTVRGELPAYLCVIGIGSNCVQPNPQQTTQQKTNQQQTSVTGQPSSMSNNGGGGGGSDYPVSVVTPPDWPTSSIIDLPSGSDTSNPSSPPSGTSVDSTITYDSGGGFSPSDPYAGLPDYTSILSSGYQILPAGLE